MYLSTSDSLSATASDSVKAISELPPDEFRPDSGKKLGHVSVGLGPSIPVELPDPPDFFDHVEVHVGGHELVLILAPFGEELAARVDEVAVAVEFPDAPRRFLSDAVDAAHEVAVRDRVRRLLELPEVLGEPGDRRRRIEDDLGALQPEEPGPFREVPVVTDVD